MSERAQPLAPGHPAGAAVADAGGLVELPDPASAVPADRPGAPGRRTISPTEAGGNVDIKHLTAGTRVYLPVFVPGALFSVGDGHFAQGDGEPCGAAVETTARMIARFDVRKGAAAGIGHLRFERLPRPARGGEPAVLRGHRDAVDDAGRIHPENIDLAARNALRSMVDYLSAEQGFTRQ